MRSHALTAVAEGQLVPFDGAAVAPLAGDEPVAIDEPDALPSVEHRLLGRLGDGDSDHLGDASAQGPVTCAWGGWGDLGREQRRDERGGRGKGRRGTSQGPRFSHRGSEPIPTASFPARGRNTHT